MDLTNSVYEGEFYKKRLEGKGKYTFSTGTIYEGTLRDGMFNGNGILYFKNGSKYVAIWKDGIAVEGTYYFSDGLKFEEVNWKYCDGYDRRFYTEVLNGIKASGETQMTNSLTSPIIPKGQYDTGDGFYDKETRIVTGYNGKFLRNADEDEDEWVTQQCRKEKQPFVGARKLPRF
ncbi:MORN repeat-containing protein 5 [Intoshia linei]|uniref:MORN repeat-containing protein 5 n=1 Tax=Intoshia linei TaxID=1819745 RepID=A0A177B2B7_9BILA|nr:MORN repeat-containing protein 5 [Intoshia linei]